MLKFQNDWNSMKHPLVEYYKETSKMLVFLPWKEVADPVPPLPGRIAKSNNFAKSNHSFLHQKWKDLCKSWLVWRQEQLEIVCTKILNFLPANLWRNPWLHQEWPSKGLNFAATTKTGQNKTGRKWCLLTNPPSYSLLPTNPSFADHMDLHQRTHVTSNQPLSTPHRSWCGGAFPAKAEVVFIFSQKDKQWMPHGILAS